MFIRRECKLPRTLNEPEESVFVVTVDKIKM